ncbi:MAG: protein arginine kinase [Phycisphaerales bacterium]|nr:MAG: protein arginine kinase [Phycisphaerales bacterium]
MTLDQLSQTTGEWLSAVGPMSDVVISSRVRLARNLAAYPFLATASAGEQTEVYRSIAQETSSLEDSTDDLFFELEDIDKTDQQVLVERHLISRQHAAAEGSRGVSVSPKETRALMINEEDHLRIQALRSGLQLEAAWEEVDGIDNALGRSLAFAFDQQYGYLTACPTNLGTGIRVSVMLHLPALRLTKEIERVERAARDMRLAVRGLYGEGTEAIGDFFQVSNQTTLGKSENEILSLFGGKIIPKVVDYERAAREALEKEHPQQLDDKIWRAYGILCNARCISSEETQVLLSPIRMGINMGRFDRMDIATLNDLFLHAQPAHLQKLHGESLSGEERAIVRADHIRQKVAK